MAFEKKLETLKAQTIRMKYTGMFRGTQKIVELPIPLISNSQKLEEVLTFTRESTKQGPAFCDVPMKWAGALLEVGGRWKACEVLAPDMLAQIAAAKAITDAEMQSFAELNELVEA